MSKKIVAVVSGLVAVLPLAAFADAPIYATTTASTAITNAYADLGVLIALVVVGVLGAWAALVGLGFSVRKGTHYVTGRKF